MIAAVTLDLCFVFLFCYAFVLVRCLFFFLFFFYSGKMENSTLKDGRWDQRAPIVLGALLRLASCLSLSLAGDDVVRACQVVKL